jgi:hypothetical protein
MENGNDDGHRFGESDYLNADDFAVGATVKVPCMAWIGRREYQTRDNKVKKAGFYTVEDRGAQKEFRLGIKNEKALALKFKLKGYEDLVNKVIVLYVEKYPMGHNGFVITGVEPAVSKVQTPQAAPLAETPEDKASVKQMNYLLGLAHAKYGAAMYKAPLTSLMGMYFDLTKKAHKDVEHLTNQEAHDLIEALKAPDSEAYVKSLEVHN